MRFLAGWIAGIATAWAVLAVWQRVPEFPDIDQEPDVWEPRRGDRRPGYDDSVALDYRFDPPRPVAATDSLIASGGGWTSPYPT